MGRDKALLMLDGETLAERGLRTLRKVCRVAAIAGGSVELERFGRIVTDRRPGCGPLGGIVAGLEDSGYEWNVFLAVDVPLLPAAGLERLLAAVGGSCVGVMARVGGFAQPLCAVYSRRALRVLQRELGEGRWKVIPAVQAAGAVVYVDFEEAEWFRNLNTPEEFAEAERESAGLGH